MKENNVEKKLIGRSSPKRHGGPAGLVVRGALALAMLAPLAALPSQAQAAQVVQPGVAQPGVQPGLGTGIGAGVGGVGAGVGGVGATAAGLAQPGTVTIGDIVADPNRFIGQRTPATFVGRVERALGPRSFIVVDEAGRRIPIVNRAPLVGEAGEPIEANALVGEQVRVTGGVNQFNLRAWEDQLGVDLDDAVWGPFAGRPAVISERVIGVDWALAAQPVGDGRVVDLPPRTVTVPGRAITVPGAAVELPPQAAQLPPRRVEVPGQAINLPPQAIAMPARQVEVPGQAINLPPQAILMPAREIEVPGQVINLPPQAIAMPAQEIAVPGQVINLPPRAITMPAQEVAVPGLAIDLPPRAIELPAQAVTVPGRAIEAPAQAITLPPREVTIPAPEVIVPAPQVAIPQPEVVVPPPRVTVPQPEVIVPPPIVEVPEAAAIVEPVAPVVREPVAVAPPVVREPVVAAPPVVERDVDVFAILGITRGVAPQFVTVDDILDNPVAYAGQYVSVAGEVGEIIGPRSFTVEDDDLFFDEELRVIGARDFGAFRPIVGGVGTGIGGVGTGVGVGEGVGVGAGLGAQEGFLAGEQVRVNGVVRTFNLATFERDFGADLDDNLYADWEGQPVLIATEVMPFVAGEAGVGVGTGVVGE